MDKFKKLETTPKSPGSRQRSISETEIDLSSPRSERVKKRSIKNKYLSLWSSKRSLDEEFSVVFFFWFWVSFFIFFGKMIEWYSIYKYRQESSTPYVRRSRKGLVRFLSFRKSKKKKSERDETSPETCLSEEVSLMEESSGESK